MKTFSALILLCASSVSISQPVDVTISFNCERVSVGVDYEELKVIHYPKTSSQVVVSLSGGFITESYTSNGVIYQNQYLIQEVKNDIVLARPITPSISGESFSFDLRKRRAVNNYRGVIAADMYVSKCY